MEEKFRGIQPEHVQIDEMHTIVRCKQRNADYLNQEEGEFGVFLSICRTTKLVLNCRVGKRTRAEAFEFLKELKSRTAGQFQLCSDGWTAYSGWDGAVREVFGNSITYATEIKDFGCQPTDIPERYTPRIVVAVHRNAKIGNPDLDMASTAHCERLNLSARQFTRRLHRCTLGFSKTLENLKHAVYLFAAYLNFCRKHSTLRASPAQAAGITDKMWGIRELLAWDLPKTPENVVIK